MIGANIIFWSFCWTSSFQLPSILGGAKIRLSAIYYYYHYMRIVGIVCSMASWKLEKKAIVMNRLENSWNFVFFSMHWCAVSWMTSRQPGELWSPAMTWAVAKLCTKYTKVQINHCPTTIYALSLTLYWMPLVEVVWWRRWFGNKKAFAYWAYQICKDKTSWTLMWHLA